MTGGVLNGRDAGGEDADERGLVERLKAHDADAVRLVYRMHSDSIYRYALFQLGNQAAAEDIAAEAFLRLLNTIDRYEYRGVPIRAYLFRIARNLIVDQQRRASRVAPLESAPDGASASENPAHLAEQRLAWGDLQAAIGELTDEQRQVVLLKFVEDLDNRQVAEVIGKNEGSVKSLQHRALASLKRILERQARGAE